MFKKAITKVFVKDGGHKLSLVNAYNEKCFWVYTGPVLSNLSDLLRAFKIMTDVQFKHHVNEEKNDFASWVSAVLLDDVCAKALRKADSPQKAARVVEVLLENYRI